MRQLNIGSGPHPFPEWLNVDVDAVWHTNVVGDAMALPFADDVFERVYLGHCLEHFPWREIGRAMREVQRVCASGSELVAVGPDMDRAILRAHEKLEPWWLIKDIRGSQDLGDHSGGGGHAWMPTEGFTVIALEDSGFLKVEPFDIADLGDGYPCVSRAPWQCAIRAVVP